MKTALLGFTRRSSPASGEGRRLPSPKRFAQAGRRRPGFGLPTGIALAILALAAVPIGVATDPSRPPEESGSESRDDKSSPTSQFLTAYNSMSLADWLEEKGLRAEATDLYTEALNLFLKVSADYPQWQPAVVSFRINYCREALNHLQGPGREDRERRTPDARRQTPDRRKMEDRGQTMDNGQRTTDDGRQPARRSLGKGGTAEDSLKRTTDGRQQMAKQRMPDDRQPGYAARLSSPKSEALSPLNFKLQQAVLKERGRDYTGALAMYIALLEEYPREPWALKGACRCCLRLGRMDKARALTRQALTLPLPDADLNLLAALVDCHDGRYQAAIPLLHQSLKQNSACPEAHTALGVALTAIGKIKKAQEEMKRALSLNPKLGDAYYNLARLSLRQKPTDHDTARVHYQNALRHGAAPDSELDTLLAE